MRKRKQSEEEMGRRGFYRKTKKLRAQSSDGFLASAGSWLNRLLLVSPTTQKPPRMGGMRDLTRQCMRRLYI